MTDYRPENRAGLSFRLGRGKLLVYHATIRALGNPEYIRFLINSEKKHIAVQCCEAIDRENIRVPEDLEGEKYSFEVSSSVLISVIYKMCGWDTDKSYSVYGELYAKNRLVDFDLTQAREISNDQFVDPENQ